MTAHFSAPSLAGKGIIESRRNNDLVLHLDVHRVVDYRRFSSVRNRERAGLAFDSSHGLEVLLLRAD